MHNLFGIGHSERFFNQERTTKYNTCILHFIQWFYSEILLRPFSGAASGQQQ
jgi:hypothetical protein